MVNYWSDVKFLGVALLVLVLSSCRMGRSGYMSDNQRQSLSTAFDSVQRDYKQLMSEYRASSDSMSPELRRLYSQMEGMHQQMATNHEQMMSMHMGERMQGKNKMMRQRMMMHMNLQNRMTGEWYQQMMGMHERMARLHQMNGQKKMAAMNRKMADEFGRMTDIKPSESGEEVPVNESGNPDVLDGRSIFSQNCASCHGSDARGYAGVFPPLVNSKWVTDSKEVPVRILLNGLSGDIKVAGSTYQGSMPAFRARLSAAEIAALLNYLRNQSSGDHPKITQQDVIKVEKKFGKRNQPWSASELESLLD